MSFFASNDRIRVTNSSGNTVFDTNTPMPHIIQDMTKTITHTFSAVPRRNDLNYTSYTDPTCYYLDYQTTCNYEYNPFSGEMEYVCTSQFVEVPHPGGTYDWTVHDDIDASEIQSTYKIGDITNSISADFIVVKINGSRSSGGSHWEFGTFVSALPSGKDIAGNGSAILESSFLAGGASWLRRIVSVYVSGTAVYAQFKHSNRARYDLYDRQERVCLSFNPSYPNYTTASTFTITFDVLVGKFTQ
jgi:hypothetical protein